MKIGDLNGKGAIGGSGPFEVGILAEGIVCHCQYAILGIKDTEDRVDGHPSASGDHLEDERLSFPGSELVGVAVIGLVAAGRDGPRQLDRLTAPRRTGHRWTRSRPAVA